jgi:type III secretory pathway component EscV
MATDFTTPIVVMEKGLGKKKELNSEETINLAEFIEVKGWKTIGNKIAGKDFVSVVLLPPDPETEIDEDVKEDMQQTESGQMLLINDDMLKEEEERIKKLLADDPEDKVVKPKPKKKPDNPEQPKLF